jgi:NMD protein affecting ribosome stability and mRNA decay
MGILKQNPDNLTCVYCGAPAETWDHIHGLVKDNRYSGYGHTIGNLLPCCRSCNSQKGNKNWEDFIQTKPDATNRSKVISQYLKKYALVMQDYDSIRNLCPAEINELESIKDKIFYLMDSADKIAENVRRKIS